VIAMLLAAGRGQRLRPLTDATPKALLEVRGKSLIERHLERLQIAGIETVVINLGWLGEQIAARVGSGQRYGLNVIYSREGDNILETGGGIQRALPLLGSAPFLAVNADILTDLSFADMLLPNSLNDNALGHLVLVPTPAGKEHGDFDLVDGKVVKAQSPSLTYSGVAMYRPEFFKNTVPGRFSLAPMFLEAAAAGQLAGSFYDGLWEDVGSHARLEALNRE